MTNNVMAGTILGGTGGSNTRPYVSIAPAKTTDPTLVLSKGSPQLPLRLFCTPGLFNEDGADPTYTYQWKRDGANIIGETASYYDATVTDVGHALTCTITDTTGSGSTTGTTGSSGTVLAAAGAPTNSVAPALIASNAGPQRPVEFFCTPGTWDSHGLEISGTTYQWKRDGTNIAGATNPYYAAVSADDGHVLTCLVTVTNGTGSTGQISNASSAVVAAAAAPSNTTPPVLTVDDPANLPLVASVTAGVWDGHGLEYVLTYQWKRDGTNISGETAATYTATADDIGTVLTCVVRATSTAGNSSVTVGPSATILDVLAPASGGGGGLNFGGAGGGHGVSFRKR